MNFDKNNGYPLFKIVKKDDDKKKPKMVYMSDRATGNGIFTTFVCEKDEEIVVVPNPTHERECSAFYGRSGAGKSYAVRKYAEGYLKNKKTKKNNIFIFSSVVVDKSLDSLGKKLKRVKLDSSFLNKGVDKEWFRDSLCIF